MDANQILLKLLEDWKARQGIRDPGPAPEIDPAKILKDLQTTEKKLTKLEKERDRFQTRDLADFEKWKKEACARELAKRDNALAEYDQMLTELRKLQEEYSSF